MIRVWLSGGQSNGTGWATDNNIGGYSPGVYALPNEYSGTTSQIKVYKSGSFQTLVPFGDASTGGYNFYGSSQNTISMEHSFFNKLSLQFPDDDFYNIKYSYGGRSISQLQGSTQATFTSGVDKLISDGQPYTIEGLLWYQGESDQHSQSNVDTYPAQLTTLIDHCVSISSTDLKVFIVRPNYLTGTAYQDEWNGMIYDYVRNESGVTASQKILFSADDLETPDGEGYIHVAGTGFFRLGTRFYNQFMNYGSNRKTIGGKTFIVGGKYKTLRKVYDDETFTPQNTGQSTVRPVVSPEWPT